MVEHPRSNNAWHMSACMISYRLSVLPVHCLIKLTTSSARTDSAVTIPRPVKSVGVWKGREGVPIGTRHAYLKALTQSRLRVASDDVSHSAKAAEYLKTGTIATVTSQCI